ncbi:VCBS repeat-containing protein [Cyclobacterium marinum]|uniref:VCBS repeat-containing protein n=1 Tax=Cyclobacterium marinum TaxID=104 RepID=UPI0011EC80ED|nr:VCBS repeat-containing protein [Cyclobacterium marinum]MBI0397150.1 VCBS repeat-containing protein [Cyclobacterium marinum]
MKNPSFLSTPYSLFLFLMLCLACQENKRFTKLSPDETGVDFENGLIEDEFFNILTYEYFYNGAGVAVADFNNDGLDDLVFTSNMGNCEIFSNEGDFSFVNRTESSGISTKGKWATGVSIVDINQDGLRDIYLCFSGPYGAIQRKNELYINLGDFKFLEKAADYGLDDSGFSTQAAFFDFDRDGDLDMYLMNNMTDETGPNIIRPKRVNGEMLNTDKLYQNNGNLTFSDVSKESGITIEGYGLGLAIADINGDLWPDIFISNDYLSNDILYLNQKDGTFKNIAEKVFPHTSYSAMGNDISDINNDGMPDFIEVDMLPNKNYRQKLMFGKTGHDRFTSEIKTGYEPQFMRNTLQLNRGYSKDSLPRFSDISFMAGVASTDWSWAPLWADWNNDGWKDLFITNGYPRDITNRDFVDYRSNFATLNSLEIFEKLKPLKGAHLGNFMFQNNQDLTFNDVSETWGFEMPGYSSGLTFSDLNNDGQLDLVINNTYSKASIYKNNGQKDENNHFLQIKLNGKKGNFQALGTKVNLYSNGQSQYYEHFLTRGYQSSVSETIHFGLGQKHTVDSLLIQWPDGNQQKLFTISANQVLNINYNPEPSNTRQKKANNLPVKIGQGPTKPLPVFEHRELYYADFNLQPLLPHKHSQLGPGIAVGDINGDKKEDLYIGGAYGQSGKLFFNNGTEGFDTLTFSRDNSQYEDMGALFFDADSDGDQDLYIASGGNEFEVGSKYYKDRLYINDGKGNFTLDSLALPEIFASSSTVVGADFDKDGDLDLFIGGRLTPNSYPKAGRSQLLQNNKGHFTEKTDEIAPGLKNIGMVTSALWTDYNQDNWLDLIVVGEWMEIKIFENQKGRLVLRESIPGLEESSGWWNSIAGADINQDGRTDYIIGNQGLNSRYKSSVANPLRIHWADFDKNGKSESIISFVEEGKRYPMHPRDDIFQQIPSLKKKFNDYHSYAQATLTTLLGQAYLDSTANKLEAMTFSSVLLLNKGEEGFDKIPLPQLAQVSPVFGIDVGDFDGNGRMEILLAGNFHQAEVITGQYDAGYGLQLEYTENGTFEIKNQTLHLSGDVRSLAPVFVGEEKGLFHLAAKNDQPSQWLSLPGKSNRAPLPEVDDSKKAILFFKNGKIRLVEFYHGSGYLSQGANHIFAEQGLEKVMYFDAHGKAIKTIQF